MKGSGFKGAAAGAPACSGVPRGQSKHHPRAPRLPAHSHIASPPPLSAERPRPLREAGGGSPKVSPYHNAPKRDPHRSQRPPCKIGPLSRPGATVALQSGPAPPRPRPPRKTPLGQHGWCRLCHVKGRRGGATAPGNRRRECGTRRSGAGIGHEEGKGRGRSRGGATG